MNVFAENVPVKRDTTYYERPIVVVIPSYNNAQWYKRNLDSVFSQVYKNYRVIYIDDCSRDGTYEFVKQYVNSNQQTHRVILIRNEKRKGALANHYKAVHMCHNHEIIINLDGDDWLQHERVFECINAAYADPRIWLTYGSYVNFPSGKNGECSKQLPKKVIRRNAYREYSYITSHLRTFYAGLFKNIKLGDLMYQGYFIPVACDMAFMFPMLEMAAGRIKLIDEILYVYNQKNPENHFRKRVLSQLKMAHISRARHKYMPLKQLPSDEQGIDQSVGIIIFSDNPQRLSTLIESIDGCILGVGSIYVFYSIPDQEMSNTKKLFPCVNYHCINDKKNFKSSLLNIIQNMSHKYIMFARDNCIVKNIVNMTECVQLLEQTGAYGFFLAFGKNITAHHCLKRYQKYPPMLEFNQDVYAWKFKHGEFDWRMVHNTMMTIYRKDIVTSQLKDLIFDLPDSLEYLWSHAAVDSEDVGLFFKQSKVVMFSDEETHYYDLINTFGIDNDTITII